jgi:hypothetical protein
MAKMKRLPFTPSDRITTRPGELLFSDIKGLFAIAGVTNNYVFFATFVDHFTRFVKVFLFCNENLTG